MFPDQDQGLFEYQKSDILKFDHVVKPPSQAESK